MFLSRKGFGIGAPLILAAGMVLGAAGPASANPDGARVSISIGTGGWGWEVAGGNWDNRWRDEDCGPRDCDYAGTLTIDGRRFHIDTDYSVREQIHEAFERMGYRAWCVGRSIRIQKDGRCGPEVCWHNGEYEIAFRERHSSITITPVRAWCDDHYGHHHRYTFDRGNGRYLAFQDVHATSSNATPSWASVGVSAFVDNDRDVEEELSDRNDLKRSEPVKRDGGSRGETRGSNRVVEKEVEKAPVNRSVTKRTTDASKRVTTVPAERVNDRKTAPSAKPVAEKPVERTPEANKRSNTKAPAVAPKVKETAGRSTPSPKNAPAKNDVKSKW